jgi:hypothetical protein
MKFQGQTEQFITTASSVYSRARKGGKDRGRAEAAAGTAGELADMPVMGKLFGALLPAITDAALAPSSGRQTGVAPSTFGSPTGATISPEAVTALAVAVKTAVIEGHVEARQRAGGAAPGPEVR